MKIYLTGGLMVVLSICANLLLKIGAEAANTKYFGIFSAYTLAGLFLFGCGGILYATFLKWVPLNIAQSVMATQYVGIILAAHLILTEPISMMRWLGIGMIAIGVFIVIRTV
jgi:undecaprenyl phosphate-alpha-L-ara4N flippase subunit ArnE